MQFIDLLLVRCIFGGQIGHNNYEDFEHPTCKGNYLWHNRVALTGRMGCGYPLPRALPWAVETLGFQPAFVWVLTHSHRLPLIYKDKYDHIFTYLYNKV